MLSMLDFFLVSSLTASFLNLGRLKQTDDNDIIICKFTTITQKLQRSKYILKRYVDVGCIDLLREGAAECCHPIPIQPLVHYRARTVYCTAFFLDSRHLYVKFKPYLCNHSLLNVLHSFRPLEYDFTGAF